MTLEEIERLVGQAERAEAEVFEYAEDGAMLVLRKRSVSLASVKDRRPAALSEAGPTAPTTKTIPALATGVFQDRHPLAKSPLVASGTRIAKGAIVGFLRIGSVLRPVCAPADCVIERPLVASGTLVGFGTPLYALAGC